MPITEVTPKSWSLNSYTNNTWTDFVSGTAGGDTVKSINISNSTAGAISVSVRVTNSGGTSLAVILPFTSIGIGEAQQLDIQSLNLTSSQKIQINCDAAGIQFFASGMSY